MIPLVLDKNAENIAAGDEENEANDNDAVSSASASSLPVSRSSSPSVSSRRNRSTYRKTPTPEKRVSMNPVTRVKIYANRLNCDRTRKGNFIRIFPRKDTFYLYKHMLEELDFRHEKQDMLLFKTVYGEDPEAFEVAGDVNEIHQELMDAKNIKSSADLSETSRLFLKEALDAAAQYEAEKHANGFRLYPSTFSPVNVLFNFLFLEALPRLHPYARRRTASQVVADEVRRNARIEAMIKPLEQEILKVASSSGILSDTKI